MIARLVSAWQELEARGCSAACVGPQLRLRGSGALSIFPRPGWGGLRSVRCSPGEGLVECDYLIASGALIPLDVFRHVGDLEEPLFIDHVDTEWCYRARAKGYRIFGVCGAVMEHQLGAGYHRIWLGRHRRIARHGALRYYYIFRNVLLVSGRSYVPLGWRARQLAWLCVLLVAFGLSSGLRSEELRMMLKGIRHGMSGNAGKLPPQREP
jgi:rhamnosyltransferase